MEFFSDLFVAIRDHPGKVLICIAVPVALSFVLKDDGAGGGWFDDDGDGGCD
jgi:hypothetical protein